MRGVWLKPRSSGPTPHGIPSRDVRLSPHAARRYSTLGDRGWRRDLSDRVLREHLQFHPAYADDVNAAIIESPDLDVITPTGGERRKANTVGVHDVIKVKTQRSFFPRS